VHISELELVKWNRQEKECILRVICGGGTYMRSLVNDLSISMGTYGHMTALQRTRQGLFELEDTLVLDETTFSVEKVLKSIAAGQSRL
jgi:tRNA pseudouridine55 synthase